MEKFHMIKPFSHIYTVSRSTVHRDNKAGRLRALARPAPGLPPVCPRSAMTGLWRLLSPRSPMPWPVRAKGWRGMRALAGSAPATEGYDLFLALSQTLPAFWTFSSAENGDRPILALPVRASASIWA